MRQPDLRISSMVWFSRLPLGMPKRSVFASAMSGRLLGGILHRILRGILRRMPIAGAVLRGIDEALIDHAPIVMVEHAKEIRFVTDVTGRAVAALLDR